jgi:hypothetical protein
MPIQSKAGQPYQRRFDPPARRVAPNGTQPFSVYTAPLVWKASFDQETGYFPFLFAPLEIMDFQLLLFGSDYPLIVHGTQQYLDSTFNANGDPNAVEGLSFDATLGAGSFGWTSPGVPNIIPSTGIPAGYKRYQEIARGTTLTHGVTTAGFPVNMVALSHGLWEAGGDAAPRSQYTFTLETVLNSGGAVGPSTYVDSSETYQPYYPVILYEPDFTQQVVDDGYKIVAPIYTYPFNGIATLDVVGLWNVDGYVPLLPGTQTGRSAAPLSLREAALAATANFRRPK